MNKQGEFFNKKRGGVLGYLIKSILFISLFFLAGIGSQSVFADECIINDVSFSQINTNKSIEAQKTKITVNLTGCAQGIQIIPKETQRSQGGAFQAENLDPEIEIENNPSNLYVPNNNKIEVEYWLYEDGCFSNQPGFDCKYYVLIKYLGNPVFNGRDYIQEISVSEESSKNYINGVLFGSCGDGFFDACDIANNSWEYKSSSVQPTSYKECTLGDGDVEFINSPFEDIGGQSIQLKIKTKNKCTGIPIQVHLMSITGDTAEPEDPGNFDGQIDIIPESDGNDYISLIAEEGKDVVISFIGHDEECIANNNTGTVIATLGISTLFGDSDDEYFDCTHYVKITNKNKKLIYSTRDNFVSWFQKSINKVQFDSQINFKKGVIGADCYGACGGDDWEYKTMTGGYGDDSSSESNTAQQYQTQTPTYDTTSPCYLADADLTTPGSQPGYNDNCYELLASIPGVGDNGEGVVISDLKNFKLGTYIQSLFNVAIGILMVLSVIMIVVAGVEYMTVESIYGKSDAKKRIVGATTGLILALGIFLILKTINPKLLEINFGDGIKEVSIKVEELGDDGNISTIVNYSKEYGNDNACDETKSNPTCVNIPNGITIKAGIGNQVEEEFSTRLSTFNTELLTSSVLSNWQVTEAFERTRIHKSRCHYIGTCIDMNFTGTMKTNPSSVNIKDVIDSADKSGLCAIYEIGTTNTTKSQTEPKRQELIQAGIPAEKIKNYAGWISAPHFSIYNGSC